MVVCVAFRLLLRRQRGTAFLKCRPMSLSSPRPSEQADYYLDLISKPPANTAADQGVTWKVTEGSLRTVFPRSVEV